MRKVAVLSLLLLVLLVPMSLSASAGVGLYAGAEQVALADWVFLRGNRGVFYFAGALRGADPFRAGTVGFVGRGPCRVMRGRDFTMVACHGTGRARPLGLADFQMDPLLSRAHMTLRDKSFTHSVDWEGSGTAPDAGGGAGAGDLGAEVSAGAVRGARANATLFGKKLGRKGDIADAFMGQGAGVMVWRDARDITITRDGRVRVRATYRIARRN